VKETSEISIQFLYGNIKRWQMWELNTTYIEERIYRGSGEVILKNDYPNSGMRK
jgi:hypothetical protein